MADFGAQALIHRILHKHFPQDPIVAEEDAQDLVDNPLLKEKVLSLVNDALREDNSECIDDKQVSFQRASHLNYQAARIHRFRSISRRK